MSGRLIYLMGASGSGKDSLLRAIKPELLEKKIWIAHRYITRSASDLSENHIELSKQEFATRKNNHAFLFHWQANQFDYAIGIEVTQWLKNGINVIINGSREHLVQTKNQSTIPVEPILITASREVRLQRLKQRNREDDKHIDDRLKRGDQYDHFIHADNIIENNTDLESAAKQLINIITKVIEQ